MMTLFFYCQANLYVYFEDYINSLLVNIDQKTEVRLYTRPISTDFFKILKNDTRDKHIFLQKVPSEAYKKINKSSIYLLSTEQLSRSGCFDYVCRRNDDNIIDYSEENIKYYGDRKNVYHIPYQINKQEIYNYKKEKNVAMVANNSPRRWQIYNEILKKNININNVKGWLKERDEKLFIHKILVNIHINEKHCKIMEQMRINRCIFNKIIVITEDSIYQDDLELKSYMLICKFNKISGFVENVINNYTEYHNKIFDDFDLEKINRKFLKKLNYFLEK